MNDCLGAFLFRDTHLLDPWLSSLQLDLSQPLEEQGPLDVIIHKLTDLILEADQNDSQAMLLVQRVQVRSLLLPTRSYCCEKKFDFIYFYGASKQNKA